MVGIAEQLLQLGPGVLGGAGRSAQMATSAALTCLWPSSVRDTCLVVHPSAWASTAMVMPDRRRDARRAAASCR
jgi:hypothetical protein